MLPQSLILIYAAVFGAVFGSFLNVVVLRDRARKTILTGRSQCPHCKRPLQWYELIPVLSFFLQGGKCRGCKKNISWQYPLGEITVGGLAAFSAWYGYFEHGSSLLALGIFAVLSLLFVISVTDLRTMEVQPEYALAALFIAWAVNIGTGTLGWLDVAIGMLLGGGLIAFFAYGWKVLTGKQGMGDGDIFIAAAVGALVGYPFILPALFIAVVLGAVIGVVLAAKEQKGLGIEMPFGPFLAIGGVLALAWGQALLQWYIL